MAKFRIDIDTDKAVSELYRITASKVGITDVINLLSGIQGGVIDSDLDIMVSPVQSVASLTIGATGQVADETFVINGVTFTAKDSGATGAQFNISTTDVSVTATNIAAAVEASVDAALADVVTTTSSAGVVTFTADTAGEAGNGYVLTESLTEATRVDFAGGSDGTEYELASKS